MPPKKAKIKKGRALIGRGMSSSKDHLTDWVGGRLQAGAAVSILSNQLVINSLRDRAYKLVAVHLQVALMAQQSACVSLTIFGPENNVYPIASTAPVLIGANPRTLTLHSPTGTDWFPTNNSISPIVNTIASIICTKQGADESNIRWVAKVDFVLSPEAFNQNSAVQEKLDGDDFTHLPSNS